MFERKGITIPNYDYLCQECGISEVAFAAYEDRDSPRMCTMCGGGSMVRYYAKMPGITRASYVDGTNRFKDFKEASKLNKEASVSKSQERKKEIAKEIRKLGVKITKD